MKLRLGTRESRLALVQSHLVAAPLSARGVEVELVPITTTGDRLAQVALSDFGGKAMFVKEIEEALLAGRIDIAVHSLKDMPAVLPDGLALGAFPARDDPRDALVSRSGGTTSSSCRSAATSIPGSRSWRKASTTRSSLRRRV